MAGSVEQDGKAGGFIRKSNCLTSFGMSKQEDAVSRLESAVETVATVDVGLAVFYVQ